jgi:hypothetical protein
MTAQFCRLQIVVEGGRLFAGLDGKEIEPSEYPLPIGSTMLHWADIARARGWFWEAMRLLNLGNGDDNDQKRLAALYAPVNTKDKTANNRQATEQFQYINDILSAIAHGYNLLNIAWHNDPVAREAYRTELAGPPKVSGQNASGVFSADRDYNPQWYTGNEWYAHTQNTSPLQTDAIQIAKGKPGDKFVPSALLVLASMDPLPSNAPVALSHRVYNAPAATSLFQQNCPVGPVYKDLSTVDFTRAIDFPWSKRCESGSKGFAFGQGYQPIKAIMPDGTTLPEGFDDWRAAYAGQFYQGDAGIAAPLAGYFAWLHGWVKSLTDRSPLQIIQDARAYTAWQNLNTLAVNASALQQIASLGSSLSQQQHAPDQGFQIAEASLGVVAGVASAAGGVGAIVGLVAGATAAVLAVTDAVVTKSIKGVGRDDLGRYKPQLERAWLSGDPGTPDASIGTPSLPDNELRDPPGEGTVWSSMDCPTAPVSGGSNDPSGSGGGSGGSGTPSLSSWWGSISTPAKVGVFAGVAGVGFLAARAFQQPPQPPYSGRSRAR